MSPSLTLYTFGPSHNAVRPELALLEKQAPFTKVEVNLLAGEHRSPEFAALNPRHQVPTLVYESGAERIVLAESIAIIRFIDDVLPEPPLMPPVAEPQARALALQRLEEFQSKLDPKNLFGSVVFGRKGKAQLQDRIQLLKEELPQWNRYLRNRDYLAGDVFTLADIAVFPLLMHCEALGFQFSTWTPALAKYVERCKQRPSVVRSGWLQRFAELLKARPPEQVLKND